MDSARLYPAAVETASVHRRSMNRRSTGRIQLRKTLLWLTALGAWLDHGAAFSLDHMVVRSHRMQQCKTSSSHTLLHSILRFTSTCRRMSVSADSGEGEASPPRKHQQPKKKKKVVKIDSSEPSRIQVELLSRMTKLEQLVAKQEMELHHLRQQCAQLAEAATAFARVVELLRQAGLETPEEPQDSKLEMPQEVNVTKTAKLDKVVKLENKTIEYLDDSEIFGKAPSSVIDAADAAGAAILAGMLGGKQRMLVDVRDAELSRDPETLVQFIELAILPVAAGLEGLKSARNRVKIVFPTVSQLLQYRRTMALAAPEVVALSTLGFDPIEKQDNIVVIVAPSPDDDEGLMAMNELLAPTDPKRKPITQPLVVLNHHMVPVLGPASKFEVAYHLRLLSVQFMTGDNAPEYFQKWEEELKEKMKRKHSEGDGLGDEILYGPDGEILSADAQDTLSTEGPTEDDAALEAAMKHAHELGVNQGVTRAMVIRAYPRPWHVFVDTSPDTDADFEVAATFDEEPSQDDVNYAIIECLEGSEHEDELVAQQMQQALEAGQLDRVSEMLGLVTGFKTNTDANGKSSNPKGNEGDNEEDNDDDLFNDFDLFEEDSC